MKLFIKRDQQSIEGALGDHGAIAFILSCRLEFTPDEEKIMTKYSMKDFPLLEVRRNQWWTTDSLKRGDSLEASRVDFVLGLEEKIKEQCKKLKILLENLATYGGEEIVEI